MTDTATAKSRSAGVAILAIGLAATSWCLSDLFGSGRVPVYRDLLTFVYPYRAFLASHLSRGDVPLWNPFIQLGVPFAASLHASAFYPPVLILLVPFPWGFNLFLLAQFVIGFAGAVTWLRNRGCCASGVVAGALVFTIGGYMVASVTNTAHLQAAVWAPWIFWAWARHVRRRRSLGATALLLGVQLLAGAPEVWLSTIFVLLAWTLTCGSHPPRERFRSAFGLAACLLVTVSITAFQLLPTFEYLSASRRIDVLSYGERTYWSMSPVSLLQLLFPHSASLLSDAERGTVGAILEPMLPLVHSIYLGIGGLCLAAAGAVRGGERAFWCIICVLGVMLALGDNSPLYGVFVRVVPGLLERIRYPEKFLFLFHVGAVVLAAEGTSAAVARRSIALRSLTAAAATLASIVSAIPVLARMHPEALVQLVAVLSGRGDWPLNAFVEPAVDLVYKGDRALGLLVAWAAIAVLYDRRWISRSLFAIVAIALLATDLASTNRGLWFSIPAEDLERSELLVDAESLRANRRRIFHYETTTGDRPIPGLVRRVPQIDERVDIRRFALETWQTLFFATGMLHGVGNVSATDSIGDQPSLDAALALLPREGALDLLGAFAVIYVVGPDELATENADLVATRDGTFVYRIRSSLPFAFLASELETKPTEISALFRLGESGFPRARRAIVTHVPEGWTSASVPTDVPDSVVLRTATSDEVAFAVRCGATRLLVVNSWDFPGWQAYIDGRPATIVRANALVQGVVVPPGEHSVRLVYRPASFRFGVAVSVFAAVALAVVSLRRPRG